MSASFNARSSQFILDEPVGLSPRAQHFLQTNAAKTLVDSGPVGEDLRSKLRAVFGGVDMQLMQLLEGVQARYAGLTYVSGYFDAVVTFAPACDPDFGDEEPEIYYAIETGSPAGASLRKNGEVEVGVDETGVIEFRNLDVVIECDAMFGIAASMPVHDAIYMSAEKLTLCLSRMAEPPISLPVVSEASGRRSRWFSDGSRMAFFCSTWSELGFETLPFVKYWGADEAALDGIRQTLMDECA